jgi:hypothetical protein
VARPEKASIRTWAKQKQLAFQVTIGGKHLLVRSIILEIEDVGPIVKEQIFYRQHLEDSPNRVHCQIRIEAHLVEHKAAAILKPEQKRAGFSAAKQEIRAHPSVLSRKHQPLPHLIDRA